MFFYLKKIISAICCVGSALPTWTIDESGDRLALCLKCFQKVWNLVRSLDDCAKLYNDKVRYFFGSLLMSVIIPFCGRRKRT